jgi:hypothetical protein
VSLSSSSRENVLLKVMLMNVKGKYIYISELKTFSLYKPRLGPNTSEIGHMQTYY